MNIFKVKQIMIGFGEIKNILKVENSAIAKNQSPQLGLQELK